MHTAGTLLALLAFALPTLSNPLPKNHHTSTTSSIVPIQTAPTTPPHHPSNQLSESKPWILKDIDIFSAANPALNASHITFTFVDTNAGLNLTTTCSRTVDATGISTSTASTSTFPTPSPQAKTSPAPVTDPLIDVSTWYPCANSSVEFQYAGFGQKISVQRSYVDPAVGEYPYDIVTGFGATVEAVNATSTGRWGTSACVAAVKATVSAVIA